MQKLGWIFVPLIFIICSAAWMWIKAFSSNVLHMYVMDCLQNTGDKRRPKHVLHSPVPIIFISYLITVLLGVSLMSVTSNSCSQMLAAPSIYKYLCMWGVLWICKHMTALFWDYSSRLRILCFGNACNVWHVISSALLILHDEM